MKPKTVPAWSAEHLLRMLEDERYEPPALGLKLEQKFDKATGTWVPVPDEYKIEVKRVTRKEGKGAFIEKRYLGRYANRAQYEANLGDMVQSLSLVRHHVVGTTGKFEQHTGQELTLVMRWVGLSVADWNELLGEASPFRTSCVAVLALVRAVLRAAEEFHATGFVHGDMLLQNIVIGRKQSDIPGLWRLNLAQTRLIDLEFSLPPPGPIRDRTGKTVHIPREWFRDIHGQPIWLHPNAHSEQLLPGPIDKSTRDWRPIDMKLMHQDADPRLQRVDWGADFFSIAYWLDGLIRVGNFVEEAAEPQIMDYLKALPDRLRTYDKPVGETRGEEGVSTEVMPHKRFMRQIDERIGPHDDDVMTLNFELPSPAAARQRRSAAPTQLSTVEPAQEPPFATPALTPMPAPSAAPEQEPAPTVRPVPAVTAGTTPSVPSKHRFGIWGGAAAIVVFVIWQVMLRNGIPTFSGQLPDFQTLDLAAAPAPAASASVAAPAPPPKPPEVPLATPTTPTPADLLVKAMASLNAQAIGSTDWLSGFNHAASLAADAAQTSANRTIFWDGVQTAYMQQTDTVINTTWWKSSPRGGPGKAEGAWLASTDALARRGVWVALVYQSRALVSGHQRTADGEAGRSKARRALAGLLTNPTQGTAPALPPERLLRERVDGAAWLFSLADEEAVRAKANNRPVSPEGETLVLPLLQSLAEAPVPAIWARLGYTAECLLPSPNRVLATKQIIRAAESDDKQTAAHAQAWRALLAEPKASICRR